MGTFLPNGYGLHDVIGNVAELTIGEARWKTGPSYLARGGSFMLMPQDSRAGETASILHEISDSDQGAGKNVRGDSRVYKRYRRVNAEV